MNNRIVNPNGGVSTLDGQAPPNADSKADTTILAGLPLVMPLAQACKICCIHPNTARELIHQNRFPGIFIGKRIKVPRVQLEAYLTGLWTA
jgi:excisionase family DNA binding protein